MLRVITLGLSIALVCVVADAQEDEVLFRPGFETEAAGFVTMDPDASLDLELVGTVTIADGSALINGGEVLNTLWLSDLVGVK